MKHLLKPLFLVLTLLCVSIGISAQELNPDDLYQVSNEGKTLTITPGTDLADVMTSLGEQNQNVTELYITGNYPNANSVNDLKSSYFPNLEKVHLTLETTSTSISNSAYRDCKLLSSIEIPSCVTSIGEYAFRNCSSLTSVGDLPACQSIGYYAFSGCSSLTSVDLPACQSIGSTAFSHCSSLTSVGDLSACQSIGNSAFSECRSLTSVGDLSACLSIGNSAFWNCPKVKIILNSENLNKWITNDYISNYFRDHEKQVKGTDTEGYDLVLTEDVTAIPDYALQNCQGLRSVTTDTPISAIGTSAFSNCKNLVAATFNDVESIGTNAFANCNNLSTARFNDVKSIGENAFPNMTYNPSKITVTSNEPATLAAVNCFNNVCLIYVPVTTLDAYHAAQYWQSHASQIIAIGCQEDYDVNVTADSNMSSLHVAIGENNLSSVVSLKVTGTINSYDLMLMRNKMTNLKSLDLTDARIVSNPYEYYQGFSSVTDVLTSHSMPDNVFTLALPASIKQINSYALSDFTNLRKLQIPASVETMEANVANGNAVTDIYFTEGSQLTSLGEKAFLNCKGIVDLKLEYTSFPTIGNSTFEGCSNMVSISIPASVNTVKENAFYGCSSLKTLNIMDSENELSMERVVYINTSYFNTLEYHPTFYFSYLQSLYLGRKIKGVNNNPFSGRGSLKNVEIGSNVTALADNLFENCRGIEELTGDLSNIEYIGNRAFSGCSKLQEFTFNDKIKSISDYAFYDCSALKSIDIPVNITTLGQHTFDGCTAATECVIPANSQISTIPTYCFANCTALKKVNLPVSVKEIENYAFYNCTGMEEAKISSAVNHVGDYAFNGCTKLFDVYTYTIEPQAINQNTFSQFSGATLHVPAVSWYNYYYDTQWSQFLKMVNFDEPYDYVFVEKDYTLRTDQVGTIKGNPQFDIWGGGALIIAGNLLQMAKDCYLGFKNGKWGSIIPSCGNFKPQTLYVNIDVNKDFWYAFSFPFDVDLTKVKKDGDYVFRRYDGAMRAENGSGGWQPVTDNTLKANTGYIFRTNVAGTLSIPITAPQFSTIDKIIDILTHPSSIGAEHAGWNFIGNPFTAYYSMNDMNYEAPVMVWNGTTYEAYRPGDDDHVFHPFEAFFVQRPSNKSCVSFKMNNRMSCNESEAMLTSNAKMASSTFATTANAKRKLINLTLSDGTMTDKCRVVYNDEQFMGYDADCDAAKFVSSENVPQIYTIDDNGTKYAINERPMQDSKVMLGYVANADGEYTIAAPRMDAKVVIFDSEENVLHDFADGDYTFETVAGTNNTRFAIYSSDMIPTGIKEIAGVDADAESEGNAYDLGGRKVEKSAKGVVIKNGMKQVVK